MPIHNEPHPLSGATVRLKDHVKDGTQGLVVGDAKYRIEDWWDRVYGDSWKRAKGNPGAYHYAMRTATVDYSIPTDDEVVYGKIDGLGHLVHVSELGEVTV